MRLVGKGFAQKVGRRRVGSEVSTPGPCQHAGGAKMQSVPGLDAGCNRFLVLLSKVVAMRLRISLARGDMCFWAVVCIVLACIGGEAGSGRGGAAAGEGGGGEIGGGPKFYMSVVMAGR
eukprot:2120343-Rhodomonas_salina.3